MVTGRLKFDNQLGGVDLSLREDIADLQLRAEVTSNKLDYEQDFQELLGQLAELHAEIILNLDAPTEIALRLSDKEPSIQMVLLHLRHLFHAQNLPLAVATILGNPLSRHVARHALETTAFVTEPDWMQLQSAPNMLTWTDPEGPPARPGPLRPASRRRAASSRRSATSRDRTRS